MSNILKEMSAIVPKWKDRIRKNDKSGELNNITDTLNILEAEVEDTLNVLK